MTPQKTLRSLCVLFPAFLTWWDTEEAPPPTEGLVDGIYYEWTHHAVLREFLTFFAQNHADFDAKQIAQFGHWVNEAVANGGLVENAVSTCFLEHMHQVRIDRVVSPYLSKQAKEKAHA